MSNLRDDIKALMRRVRDRGRLPGSQHIVDEAFDALGYVPGEITPLEAVERFNELLHGVWRETLEVLERHEERSYAKGIPGQLIEQYPDEFSEAEEVANTRGFRAGVMRLFTLWYPLLRRCFLSVSQSRKTRGGRDFELQIQGLFDLAHIPYLSQERQNRTDLILPDLVTFNRNRNESAVVSVKRPLRERWREVAEELFNLRSPNVFLFTADDNVTQGHVHGICEGYNIYLVVWDELKYDKFRDESLVLSYTEWANERLPQFRQYW